MILRMTASCNNRCTFCMVDDEIAAGNVRPLAELLAEVDAVAAEEEIDIFGGESTIDRSFWPVLERALASGRRVTLATNARLFSHRPSAERLGALGGGRLIVRTSLLGDTAELHDRLNVANNAFRQTMDGIRNLVDQGFAVRVNIVALAENVERLLATAVVALSAGVRHIKISGLIRSHKTRDAVPDPAILRDQIAAVVPLMRALGASVRLEKMPFCVAGPHVGFLQREADPLRAANPWYRHADPCRGCALASACPGGELGALERFGDGWMVPFDTVPDGTAEVVYHALDRFAPDEEVRFVRVVVPEEEADIEAGQQAALAMLRFWQRHPQLHLIA